MSLASANSAVWNERWARFYAASIRRFHAYASWLVSITWKRFLVLGVLLIVAAGVISKLPPFSWQVTETVTETPSPAGGVRQAAVPATPPTPGSTPARGPSVIKVEKRLPDGSESGRKDGVDISISIDERGIRISPRSRHAASAAQGATSAAKPSETAGTEKPILELRLPKDLSPEAREAVQDAVRGAQEAIADVIEAQRDAVEAAEEAKREALADLEQARKDAADAAKEASELALPGGRVHRIKHVHWGDFLPDLAFLWVLASGVIKATYKGRIQAEVKAAKATETAEEESLKRQVIEARMAAMQAQVEPHFLFNTLASIDHLIETAPQRASMMQKNLIALLRASMPTMREASATGLRDLGRELSVIRPYLEILKVRMEDRLSVRLEVADGLLSAQFPPMMIQGLVENAIKHGLEPKPEGGELVVKAEVVHGDLAVTVSDTGLGFGKGSVEGTGVGLANTRERLALLFGSKASLTVTENQPCGTAVTITLPYRSVGKEAVS